MVSSGISYPLTQGKLRACNYLRIKPYEVLSVSSKVYFFPQKGENQLVHKKRWFSKKTAAFGRYPWLQLNRGYPWEGWRSSVGEPDLVTGGWWLGAVCFSSFNHVNYTCRTIHHPKQDVSTGELWIWNRCRECCSLSKKHFQPGICGSSCTHASCTSLFVLSRRQWLILRTATQIRRFFFSKSRKRVWMCLAGTGRTSARSSATSKDKGHFF